MAPAADVDELKATNVILMQYSTPMDGGTLHGSPMARLPRLLHHDATVNHDTSDESSQWEIKKLDAELAGLKAMLNQIAARAILLKRRRNSLSPVLRLPQEILAEIFVVAFPYNRRECWAAKTPLLLGKVCSAWRAISWSTPQLWCTLWWHSTIVTGYQHYSGTKIALLREWLARAGSMPLALSVFLTGGHSSMYEILDILARSAAQWKDVNFSFSRCFTEGRCFVPTQFPLLESLAVQMVGQEYGYQCSVTFSDAPRLRTVHLRGFSRPSLVLLPLDRHLDISLMQVSARDCLEILNSNPNTISLVVCSLCEGRHQAGRPARFPEIVVAPHLRSLTLQTDEDTIAPLLQQLVAPVLRTLNITLDLEQNFPWTFLASFISRSNCSMSFKHFSLDFEIITGGLLMQLLLTMPSLVTLELAAEKLNPSIFQHIIRHHQSDALVPNLEHFVFRGEDLFGFWEFLIVLKSRWYIPPLDGQALDLPTRLRSVHVEVAPGRNAKAELESSAIRFGFQKLQAEGMDIELVISGKVVELGPMPETVL